MAVRPRRVTVLVLGAVALLSAVMITRSADTPPSPPVAPPRPSPGCGQPGEPGGTFQRRELRVGDRLRSFHLRLPDGYAPARAYPLVFRFHGHSGDGLSGGLEIERSAGAQAIIVGADGLNANWTGASEASDLSFFDAIHAAVSQRYCVDLGRVFAYGFSAGGGMTNLLSCARADKLRASATVAGFERGGGRCALPVAGWFLHDRQDTAVPLSEGKRARDRLRARNHCSGRSVKIDADCVRYEGCEPRAPVVWCETDGLGHEPDGERAPEKVWAFFSSLP